MSRSFLGSCGTLEGGGQAVRADRWRDRDARRASDHATCLSARRLAVREQERGEEQRAAPSRLRRLFEGRAKYLTWAALFVVWGGTILGIVLAIVPARSTGKGALLPSHLGKNTSMDLHVGCTGGAVVVACFEQVGAFSFPGGQHRWTRTLSKRVESGLSLAKKDGEVRCYPLDVDLRKGTVAVPVRGGWRPEFDLQTGQPR